MKFILNFLNVVVSDENFCWGKEKKGLFFEYVISVLESVVECWSSFIFVLFKF